MNLNKAELTVRVRLEQYGPPIERILTIDSPYEIGFAPIDRCDDPLIACITDGKLPNEVRVIAKKRKEWAKRLADQIADEIYKLMESLDTINGYPIENNQRPEGEGEG